VVGRSPPLGSRQRSHTCLNDPWPSAAHCIRYPWWPLGIPRERETIKEIWPPMVHAGQGISFDLVVRCLRWLPVAVRSNCTRRLCARHLAFGSRTIRLPAAAQNEADARTKLVKEGAHSSVLMTTRAEEAPYHLGTRDGLAVHILTWSRTLTAPRPQVSPRQLHRGTHTLDFRQLDRSNGTLARFRNRSFHQGFRRSPRRSRWREGTIKGGIAVRHPAPQSCTFIGHALRPLSAELPLPAPRTR